ncbi:MAG TPA: ATP-binding protein, partial [Polyangiaceae bacterium]|nr:ATP-binding protein [Polyangiaceae bacterium]
KQVRGSGIGLALVQHIASNHGGQVWVESTVGKGSSFLLTLPVRSQVSPSRAAFAQAPPNEAHRDASE